ncbi:adenylate/guanylate cyclase domain-containing protein [Coleofasciculus sp.]|uniref:adenylate/guanylate cyclase domain-containing protein n=1 Tax=Coleofasciculus sp. TaxID=3100458 RepID=UPI003A34187D
MSYLIYDPDTPNRKVYKLEPGVNTIGREDDNTIVVLHGYLSRHHAQIVISSNSDSATLTDLQSLNGTFVNECKIEECQIKHGDLIRFGSVFFKFVKTFPTPQQKPINEDTSNLSILRQVAPEKTRITMQELLQPEKADHSVLKLRNQDAHQRSVNKLQILLEVSKQLSSPEKPDRLLQKILDLLFEIMQVDRAAILMVDEKTGELEQKAVKLQFDSQENARFYSKRIANFVRKQGNAILTDDARIDTLFNDSVSILKQGIHAAMCVPLKPRDTVIGVLYVDNLSMTDIYSEEDLEFLTCLANQAAIAIENSRLYTQMQAEAVMRDKLERFFPRTVSRKLREEGNLEIVDTEVTALFADISNFTKMSSQMEPRQIIEMLNEYFQVMVEEIVFPYEGTLEKYIGDALLAVWGAPYRKPNDVDLAVQAAIDMQWAVRRLNQVWIQRKRRPIQIHIGLNTGKVAAGNIGSAKLIQYATIGDTTNVTSRICNLAKPNEILIAQSTLDKLNDRTIPVEKMPPMRVKGKSKPLDLYRVLWYKTNKEKGI